MSARRANGLRWVLALLAALALGGCSNPDAPGIRGGSDEEAASGSPGEPSAPPPPAPSEAGAANVQGTAVRALGAFASLYVNWSYQDLTSRQRTLAAMSLGSARDAELQAAASSSSDETLRAAQLRNSGTVMSVARDQGEPGLWVIVTREQTGGSGGYEGLPPAYHVTLARLAKVPGGYAVSEWLPQS